MTAVELKDQGHGEWQLVDTMSRPLPLEKINDTVSSVMELHIGGIAYLSARTLAAAALITSSWPDPAPLLSTLSEGRRPASLLFVTRTAVTVQEATLVPSADGGIAYLPKGARRRGYRLTPGRHWPVMVASGYNARQSLAVSFAAVLRDVPATVACDFDGVPPYHSGAEVQAAYLFTHPGFEPEQPIGGCLYFAQGYDPEDDVVDGYMWFPPSAGYSENGSVHGADLKRWGGRIPGWKPDVMTLDDCFELPAGQPECYAAIIRYLSDPGPGGAMRNPR